jgi:hypothetical protein
MPTIFAKILGVANFNISVTASRRGLQPFGVGYASRVDLSEALDSDQLQPRSQRPPTLILTAPDGALRLSIP